VIINVCVNLYISADFLKLDKIALSGYKGAKRVCVHVDASIICSSLSRSSTLSVRVVYSHEAFLRDS
jgi:hypothetical protein